jgi:3-carboxy-cis,cis-muconate cycloisomerase
VLLRRTAVNAPLLGAQLQLAAAGSVEERADGAWHAEWASLRDLARRALAAGHLATELLCGLEVHPDQMRSHAEELGR